MTFPKITVETLNSINPEVEETRDSLIEQLVTEQPVMVSFIHHVSTDDVQMVAIGAAIALFYEALKREIDKAKVTE